MGRRFGAYGFGSGSFSSAQTRLSWSYVIDGSAVVSGTLIWPSDYNDAAKDYAVELLKGAESSLKIGCALVDPPKQFDFGTSSPGVSAVDVEPAVLSRTEQFLLEAIRRMKPNHCRGAERR